jgi:hypothetical protein
MEALALTWSGPLAGHVAIRGDILCVLQVNG